MSKAKELAREIKDYIDDANMGPRSMMLVAKLVGAVLSEPEPEPELRGFIEDVSTKGRRRLVHLYYDVVYVEESSNIVMRYFEESQIELSITFDQLKQLIKGAS